MGATPKKLKPFISAHKLKLIDRDREIHAWVGTYGISAITVAVERLLNGKKSKSEYIKTPIFESICENDNLSQEEIEMKEIQKAIMVERQWIAMAIQGGLPETKI